MLDGLLRILTGVDDADRAGERNDPAFNLVGAEFNTGLHPMRARDREAGYAAVWHGQKSWTNSS